MSIFTPPHLLDSHRWRGMRIGLLGGSFNPPHEGHVHISKVALKRLNLDCVWWIVSPGNPLKPGAEYLPYEKRLTLCQKMANHPRIVVSDLERQTGTTRTIETLKKMKAAYPHTRFVWLSGADIVHQMPRWYKWREMPVLASLAFIARPPVLSWVRQSAIRMRIRRNIFVSGASNLPLMTRKCFWLLHGSVNRNASSLLRKNNKNN